MKRSIIAVVLAGILLPGVVFAREDSTGWFWWQNKPKTQARQQPAPSAPLASQQTDAGEYRGRVHEKRMAKLREKLDKDKRLSEMDKTELIAIYERHYASRAARQEKRRKDNQAFLERIQADKSLSHTQKKKGVEDYFAQSREELQELQKQERDELFAFWQKIRDENARSGSSKSSKKYKQGRTPRGKKMPPRKRPHLPPEAKKGSLAKP